MSKTQVKINGRDAILNPFAYKDLIKSYAAAVVSGLGGTRVEINGERVYASAATKGIDVKNPGRSAKFTLYFSRAKGAEREWLPITAEEYAAYKADPAFVLRIETVAAEQSADGLVRAARQAGLIQPAEAAPEQPDGEAKPSRRAKRAAA